MDKQKDKTKKDKENKPKDPLTKEKNFRLFYRILFALAAFVAPLIIVSIKYNLITEFNGYKLSAVGLILCIIILWCFKNKLVEWISNWEYSIMKYILLGFSKVYIFIIILAVLVLAEQEIANLKFCIEWVCVCEAVAYLIFLPLEQSHDYKVKRIIRGNERKEDYKSAIKELEGRY